MKASEASERACVDETTEANAREATEMAGVAEATVGSVPEAIEITRVVETTGTDVCDAVESLKQMHRGHEAVECKQLLVHDRYAKRRGGSPLLLCSQIVKCCEKLND